MTKNEAWPFQTPRASPGRPCGTTAAGDSRGAPGSASTSATASPGAPGDGQILAGGGAVPANPRQPVDERGAVGRGVVEVARVRQRLALPARGARERRRSARSGATPAAARAALIAASSDSSARERWQRPRGLGSPRAECRERDERAGYDVPPAHRGECTGPFASAVLFYRNLPILQRVRADGEVRARRRNVVGAEPAACATRRQRRPNARSRPRARRAPPRAARR